MNKHVEHYKACLKIIHAQAAEKKARANSAEYTDDALAKIRLHATFPNACEVDEPVEQDHIFALAWSFGWRPIGFASLAELQSFNWAN